MAHHHVSAICSLLASETTGRLRNSACRVSSEYSVEGGVLKRKESGVLLSDGMCEGIKEECGGSFRVAQQFGL